MSLFRALGLAPKPKRQRDPAKAAYRGETAAERQQVEDATLASRYAREERAVEVHILSQGYGSTVLAMMRATPERALALAPALIEAMGEADKETRWAVYRMIAKRFPIDDDLDEEPTFATRLKKAMNV